MGVGKTYRELGLGRVAVDDEEEYRSTRVAAASGTTLMRGSGGDELVLRGGKGMHGRGDGRGRGGRYR